VAIHVTGKDLLAHLDFINSIEARVVIDHIARLDVTEGVGGTAFTTLRRLLDGGRVWVKLSGTDRVSKQAPPFRDAVALARALAEHAPERVVWGTDWPHPNIDAHMPDDGQLVDSIAEIAPNESTRRRMLVDNPAELFGF
jgi:predicted TIM-barrel fold metal-dependent hydrolase